MSFVPSLTLSLFKPNAACRAENLQEDMDELVGLLNSKRDEDLDSLDNSVGWAQKGPLAKAGADTSADSSEIGKHRQDEQRSSPHLIKFTECGEACFQHTQAYYAKDFYLLKYEQLVS